MYHLTAYTIGEGIEKALCLLETTSDVEVRENQDKYDLTKEIGLALDIKYPTVEPFISRCICTDLKGLAKYDHEFLDGIADNAGWKYTYHQLYEKYYDDVINELKRNTHTRRACIALGQGDINFTADPPCLQLMTFNYVNGRLEMTVIFRSNDAVKAFPMNIHACEMLHEKVCEDVHLTVGPLHYIAINFHAYSKDWTTLKTYCKTFRTAPYKRKFWSRKELMEVYNDK